MPPPEPARRDSAEDAQWSRPECQAWTATLLLGTCLLYCTRVSMPVCAVSMSQDFGWNKKEAGIALSSFFWGYCLTQVAGGHLGDRVGGEKIILLSATAWGFITAATPLLTHLGGAHLVFMTFSRILTGLLQGLYFPALTSLLSQKVRESERAFTYSAVGCGSQFGTLMTGAVGSLLLDWYGWQSVFYVSGGLTLLWVCYVYRYLLSEQDLILAVGVLVQGLPVARDTRVPWRQLFRKPSVWAAIFSQFSAACSFFILLSWLPTFFKETFPSSKGWVFNVVPWLVAIPASLFSGFLSDHLISQGYRTITVRKFMQPPSASRPSTTAAFPLTSRTWPRPARVFSLVRTETGAGVDRKRLPSPSLARPASPVPWAPRRAAVGRGGPPWGSSDQSSFSVPCSQVWPTRLGLWQVSWAWA
ncbi:solute carrier family 17 member 9 isoform X3 [Pteropus alecto]|uniref:solute carrier family 17 member 9 isoform X3 n=1 Tax=Pteropus alecto TaxID=9402 RepID=UPI0007687D76|nr:solute carrier family 17 member 9 isoform X3 [Pteropus alecto]